MSVSLRPAVAADEEMVFEWRNIPFLVARATSQRNVTREEHRRWFSETIQGTKRAMFIVEIDGCAAGQVRFDRKDPSGCVISAYLLEAFTGKGHGVEAIQLGCAQIERKWQVPRVIACVRCDNPPGHAAFLKAGFHESDHILGACPPAHYTMIWEPRS